MARFETRAAGGLLIVGSLLFCAATYPALGSWFTADDFVLLRHSTASSVSAALPYFLTDWGGVRGQGGYYRPLINVLLAIDFSLYGTYAPGFRATNVGFHVGCTVLVFLIAIKRIGLTPQGAVFAAVLFLLHPFHDQAVLWIAGRTDVVSTLFSLAAFFFATSRQRPLRLLAIPAFALAFLAKEMAVTVPLVIAAYGWSFHQGSYSQRFRYGILLAAPTMGTLVAAIAWRSWILGGIGGDSAFHRWDLAALKSTAKLLQWVLVPWDLTLLRSALRRSPAVAYSASAVWIVALALVTRAIRRERPALFASFWIAITLIPVHGRPSAWYLYLPSVGATLLMAIALQTPPSRHWRRGLATVAVISFAVTLHLNARHMADASHIVEEAVMFFRHNPQRWYLVNAPIAFRGRIPVLTSEEMYSLALEMGGAQARVTPLNYAYIASRTSPSTEVTLDSDDLSIFIESDANTFLTLDNVVPDGYPNPQPGMIQRGFLATYEITRMNGQGKITGVTIHGLPLDVTTAPARIAEFRDGRFRQLLAR